MASGSDSLQLREEDHVDADAERIIARITSALQRMLALHGAAKIVRRKQHDDPALPFQSFDFRGPLTP